MNTTYDRVMNESGEVFLSYPVYRSSDYIPLPENREELDFVSHDPLDSSDILNICTAIVGLIGNSLTLLILILSKKLQTVPNLFVGHLAAIDFLVCVSMLANLFMRSHEICLYMGPVVILFMGQSLFSMAQIAVNRYVLICKTRKLYDKMYTKKNIFMMLTGGYFYMAIALVPPYFGFGSFTYNVKFQCCYIGAYDLYAYIHGCILLSAFMAPVMVLVIFCYYKIITKFISSQQNLKTKLTKPSAFVPDSSPAISPAISPEDSGSKPSISSAVDMKDYDERKRENTLKKKAEKQHKTKAMKKKDIRAFKTIMSMMVIFIIFVLAWLPSEMTYLIDFWGKLPARLHTHLISIAWMNSANNIFVYALLNNNFRVAYHKVITCRWSEL